MIVMEADGSRQQRCGKRSFQNTAAQWALCTHLSRLPANMRRLCALALSTRRRLRETHPLKKGAVSGSPHSYSGDVYAAADRLDSNSLD